MTLRNALGDVKTPNLVCRTLVGSGTVDVDFEQSDKTKANFDKNDTNWLLGRTGGEYKHQLTVAEMPSHSHTINKGNFGFHFLNFIGDSLYAKIDIDLLKNDIPLYGTDSEGNDKGHNTMQPYYVIHYIIYAGSE
ncbi:hypothetical protein [Flavobacterium lipolyticum]|uniref:Uncharacterized protein n=1 Tax=Flavobacterium lipolyticum TaxID=2893754 RepID=A0ABS8M6K5_9FLAO|nr:hypothetical protein [Flavobacterium sp. F-126]MCC9020460.1 hypothetical protein [Flavobacterium sp. F-126]